MLLWKPICRMYILKILKACVQRETSTKLSYRKWVQGAEHHPLRAPFMYFVTHFLLTDAFASTHHSQQLPRRGVLQKSTVLPSEIELYSSPSPSLRFAARSNCLAEAFYTTTMNSDTMNNDAMNNDTSIPSSSKFEATIS